MERPSDLAARAETAARRARAADPHLSRLTPDTVEWRMRARHTRLIAAALGVDPAAVVVTDDPARRTGRYPAYLITVYDTPTSHQATAEEDIPAGAAAFRFIPEPGVDGCYLLLVACQACRRPVPGPAVASLTDLGRVLASDPALSTSYAQWDLGHRPGCPLLRPTH